MIEMTVATIGKPNNGRILGQDEAIDMIGRLNDQARKGDLIRMMYPNGQQFRARVIRAWLKGDKVMMQMEQA